MRLRVRSVLGSFLALGLLTISGFAADLTDSLKQGTPDLKSVGPLAFGPEGILFVADPQAAAIFAFDTGDTGPLSSGSLEIENLGNKIASMLGISQDELLIVDLAVNPASGNAYLSVSRGRGEEAVPVLLRVDRASGNLEALDLGSLNFSKTSLSNPVESGRRRMDSITDLGFVDGQVFVAGLSNEEFSSKLRSIPFPFTEAGKGTSVEMYHAAHGRFETNSPVRTFVPFEIGNESHLLAAYTCTPLVAFPVSSLKPGERVMGKTIAELGNGNRPYDMIVYEKDGRNFILLANSRRGVMKITTDGINSQEGLTEHVTSGETAGLPYETLSDMGGLVLQLDRLDSGHALIVVQAESGSLNLSTIALP